MVSSISRVGAEVLLPSIGNPFRRMATSLSAWLILPVVFLASCSKPASPAAPDQPQDPYLGTWTGQVASHVIGGGVATVVLDSRLQTTPTSFALISGRWMFVFPDPKFSASGTVSGGLLPDGSYFVLLFSRSTVPCPGAPGEISEKGRSASLIVAGTRMSGDYIDNGCPGGFLDLVRK
jgi:hypothetical protein